MSILEAIGSGFRIRSSIGLSAYNLPYINRYRLNPYRFGKSGAIRSSAIASNQYHAWQTNRVVLTPLTLFTTLSQPYSFISVFEDDNLLYRICDVFVSMYQVIEIRQSQDFVTKMRTFLISETGTI